MMHQIALRMRDFHRLGYVHRDLKPGNVMWLPRQNRWTVIDFGCTARAGELARLGFSLAYAAPEVIAAYRAGENAMVAQVGSTFTHLLQHPRRRSTQWMTLQAAIFDSSKFQIAKLCRAS